MKTGWCSSLLQRTVSNSDSYVGYQGFTFTTSKFGKPAIAIGKYKFNKSSKCRGPKVIWNCNWTSRGSYITTSRRGQPQLFLRGHRYYLDKRTRNKLKNYWMCGRWSVGCRAALTTFDNKVVKMRNIHTHLPDWHRRGKAPGSPSSGFGFESCE
ncbi:hypothetical protein JYU34_004446 [Plutella xylostella]|uniref:FLYWCH-type domain-containing protein n=1 Tax=Plutella xylostella TaxID=51655 RepID=A0ABQ7QY03_PLUXY|nr:hypothetical protein JYU34_004446 [Plutella xylostella]